MSFLVNPFLASPPYAETGILGYDGTSPAYDNVYSCAANEHGGILLTVPAGGVWVKTWHTIVNATTAGNKIKPVLWNCANGTSMQSTDTLLKVGTEIVFPSTIASGGTTEFSSNWNSDGSAYFIAAGTYGIGYHSNATTSVRAKNAASTSSWFKSDTYSDGVEATFGANSSSIKRPVFWTPYSVTGP